MIAFKIIIVFTTIFFILTTCFSAELEQKKNMLESLRLELLRRVRFPVSQLTQLDIDFSNVSSDLRKIVKEDLKDDQFYEIFKKLESKGWVKIRIQSLDGGFSSSKVSKGGIISVPQGYESLSGKRRIKILEHEFWEIYIAHKYLKEREALSRLLGEIGRFYQYGSPEYGDLQDFVKTLSDINIMGFQIKEGFVEKAKDYAQIKLNQAMEKVSQAPKDFLYKQFIQTYILTVLPFELETKEIQPARKVYEEHLTQLKEIYRDLLSDKEMEGLIDNYIKPLKDKQQQALDERNYYPRRNELENILFSLLLKREKDS